MTAKLEKASIMVLDRDRELVRQDGRIPTTFFVQFNPTEFTRAKTAQFAEIAIPGLDSPLLQFVAGQNEKLTLDLFFDTTDGGMGEGATDVQTQTNNFYQLVKVQPKLHAPPRIEFAWGKKVRFQAVVESVQQKFTLFSPEGVPLRATLSVGFREYKSLDEQLRELNLQSADHTRTYVVVAGDTLGGIAARYYGNPGAWRVIAEGNRAALPSLRRLTPGTRLVLPPLDDAALAGGGRR